MSLLDIANDIKKEGFDPRKDSANGPKPIPAGTYPVVLKKATFSVAESDWEMLGYQFEVRGGDYDGRQEFATFGTLDEWKGKSLKWSVERTVKFFQKAITLAGDDTLKKTLWMASPWKKRLVVRRLAAITILLLQKPLVKMDRLTADMIWKNKKKDLLEVTIQWISQTMTYPFKFRTFRQICGR